MKHLTLIFTLILITFGAVYGQNGEELVVPLSDPAKKGLLKVSLHSGSIKVTGYSGKEVIISVDTEIKKVSESGRNGLRRIPNRSLGLTAREEDNIVVISSSNFNKELGLDIKVPVNFDLKLRGHNDGGIIVENVNGDMDIGHHNEDVTMINVSGSAVVNSHNGDIKVVFKNVTPNTPMAFTSWNGDVDITFPSTLKASLKMQTERGEMLTDFDIEVKSTPPKRQEDKDGGVYKISLQEWTYADVNGGGPEILFKTYNGDVIIRKK